MPPGLCCCSLLMFSFHEGFRWASHLGEGTVQIHRKAAQGHFIRGQRRGDLGHRHQRSCPLRGDSWDHLRPSQALTVCTLPVFPNPPTPTHLHEQMRLHSLKDGSPGSSLTWSQGQPRGHHHPNGLALVREGEAPRLERQTGTLAQWSPPQGASSRTAHCHSSQVSARHPPARGCRVQQRKGSSKIRDNAPMKFLTSHLSNWGRRGWEPSGQRS